MSKRVSVKMVKSMKGQDVSASGIFQAQETYLKDKEYVVHESLANAFIQCGAAVASSGAPAASAKKGAPENKAEAGAPEDKGHKAEKEDKAEKSEKPEKKKGLF